MSDDVKSDSGSNADRGESIEILGRARTVGELILLLQKLPADMLVSHHEMVYLRDVDGELVGDPSAEGCGCLGALELRIWNLPEAFVKRPRHWLLLCAAPDEDEEK